MGDRMMSISSHQFLRGFFSNCPTDQFIELFYIHPVTRKVASNFVRIGDWPTLHEALGSAQGWNERGYGVFFGICPRTSDLTCPDKVTRGKETDVNTIPGFWAEIDSVKDGRTAEDDLQLLQNCEAPPSFCVLSGGGVHAYWLFDKAYQMADDERAGIKSAIKGLGALFEGDLQVAEFARNLRVPGFVNTKPERAGAIVEFIPPVEKRRYKLDDLIVYKIPEATSKPAYVPPAGQSEDDVVELARLALNALNLSRRDEYERWIEVGHCLHSLGEVGFSLWDSWSSGSPKYRQGECERKWEGFRNQGRSIGSLFFLANEDSGRGWRPLRQTKVPSRPMDAQDDVELEAMTPKPGAIWGAGLPVMVRGLMNAYALPCASLLLELIIEGLYHKILNAGDQITVECLLHVSDVLGRGVTERSIRTGIKAGADPHGVQFLTKTSLYYRSPYKTERTDLSAVFENNPCGCPGRIPDYYDLLDTDTILANLSKAIIMPVLKRAFPEDGDAIAPVRSEILAALGRQDADTLATELDKRYKTVLEEQPGYAEALTQARNDYRYYVYLLSIQEDAPIPVGQKYPNHAGYVAACARALIEAHGGETQFTRTYLCRRLGCKDRELKGVLDRAHVDILKDQTIDIPARGIEQVKKLRPNYYDKAMGGYPAALVSGEQVFPLKKAGLIVWAKSVFESGKPVSIRYGQANRQRTRRMTCWKLLAIKAVLKALGNIPVEESVEQQALMPETKEEAAPQPAEEPKGNRYALQERIKRLLPFLIDCFTPKAAPESYEEKWLRRLVEKSTPSADIAFGSPDLETRGYVRQLAFEVLLDDGYRRPVKMKEVQPLETIPDKEPEMTLEQKQTTKDTADIVAWMVSDLGGTVSAVHDRGTPEYQLHAGT